MGVNGSRDDQMDHQVSIRVGSVPIINITVALGDGESIVKLSPTYSLDRDSEFLTRLDGLMG
jgi:hypothetical protein